MLTIDNRTLAENSTMLERANPYPSKVVWVGIPGNACNLSCEYCYVGSAKGGSAGRFPHPVDYVLKCFAPKRFGGPIFFGGGETLLAKDIVPLTEGMLSYGHVVSYTTNMTLTPVLRQFCEFPANLRTGLEIDGSLHYLELKRLNKLDMYFDNLKMLKDAGISIAIFLVISDHYIPYLREISDLCREKIGLLPIAGAMRDYDKKGGKLKKDYSQIDGIVKETCDVRQWELQKRIYGHKRMEFCHAGEYSVNVNLANGAYRKCWNHGELGNIFRDPNEPVKFEPVGKCPFYDCVCASYLCWGLIPQLEVSTHSRIYFTKDSVSQRVWNFMDSKINELDTRKADVNGSDVNMAGQGASVDPVESEDFRVVATEKADWDNLWKDDFTYGPVDAWEKDIFTTIAELLKDIERPKILSAGCGRGLIDYWLVNIFGYHVTLLDSSRQCIANLERSFGQLDKSRYSLCHGSVFDIPYASGTFDLVWNEGVLEHFNDAEYHKAIEEMARVSKRFVLVDVPNGCCKPYMLSKKWLEENKMWSWGYEEPKTSMRDDFEMAGMKVLAERPIGNKTTISNYINMIPAEHRSSVVDQLREEDSEVFPHLLTVGEVARRTDKQQAELDYWIDLSRELTKDCATDVQKRDALLKVCYEKAFPRYKESLGVEDDSFVGKRILDVGCGPHCGIIGFGGCEKYGVDHLVDAYMEIGYPLSDHGVGYSNCKSEDMPFDNDFFDVAICVNALDHVDDLEKTIREIARVLKTGGRLIGQFNFRESPTRTKPICFNHETLSEICETNQLRLRKVVYQYRMPKTKEERYYYEFEKVAKGRPFSSSIHLAERFLEQCIRDGLAHSYDVIKKTWVKPYPEVTGYLLSYFANDTRSNEVRSSVITAAEKLIVIQDDQGGFPSFSDEHYLFTFDTGQIIHGLASLFKKTGEQKYLSAATACGEFVCDMQLPDGSMFPVYDLRYGAKYVDNDGTWGNSFSPIQAKNIEGLLLLSGLTSNEKYRTAAQKLARWSKQHCDLTYTHPGAYCLEGLLAIGEEEFVRDRLKEEIIPRIGSNGFLAYSEDLPYSYVSGSVQMAILLFKLGFKEESRSILEWARVVQSNHFMGGLFQYAGKDGELDDHVHTEMNSWGTKYFAQLERMWL